MDTKEMYLLIVVTLLFLGGIGLLVSSVRERVKLRKEWSWRG